MGKEVDDVGEREDDPPAEELVGEVVCETGPSASPMRVGMRRLSKFTFIRSFRPPKSVVSGEGAFLFAPPAVGRRPRGLLDVLPEVLAMMSYRFVATLCSLQS